MFFVLQTANVAADAKNCVYPNRAEITSGDALKVAVDFDHVCGEFKKNYRNISNFLKSNVIVMDCDNDHSEDPDDWITLEKLEELFEEIDYAAVPSRNHMKEKDGRAARPKFHVYFPIEETEDADYYAAVKKAIQKAFPFFDDNALDAARFIFGSDPDEVVWHEGWMSIEEEVTPDYVGADDEDIPVSSGPITVGNRNNAMSHFAGRVLKKCGITDKAKEAFLEHAKRCDPPLEQSEHMQLVDARTQYFAAMQALIDGGIPEEVVRAGGKALEKLITPDLNDAYKEYLAAKAYYAFVMKYRNYKNIVNTQSAAKPMVATDINLFDAQENYLNTPEATYDLKKGLDGARVHNSADLLTKITNAAPGDEGRDLWEAALQLFFCGNQDLIGYVQETVGLAAIGKVYEEALIIAYGEGHNGKSTFWNTVSRVLGTYSGAISADALTAGCRRNVKPEIAELKGKRLIIAAELEEGMRLSTSILKQLCSTDQIRGEKKFKDPFDFTPSHTVVLYTNHLPKVGASDEGTWRRLIVIPFHAKIEGKSDIKNYSDYLYEHAAPAIMSWIIEGAKRVIGHDHKPVKPKVVVEAIAAYRGMNDWMGIFLEECCDAGDGLECKSGELYEEFRSYCLRTGEYARTNADFVLELEKRGFSRKKKKSGMWVQGLQLKDTDFAD